MYVVCLLSSFPSIERGTCTGDGLHRLHPSCDTLSFGLSAAASSVDDRHNLRLRERHTQWAKLILSQDNNENTVSPSGTKQVVLLKLFITKVQ